MNFYFIFRLISYDAADTLGGIIYAFQPLCVTVLCFKSYLGISMMKSCLFTY